jgi:hypothetical protein
VVKDEFVEKATFIEENLQTLQRGHMGDDLHNRLLPSGNQAKALV